VGEVFERWDGKGEPRRLAGEDIALPARYTQVATRAVAFRELGGEDAALESVRRSAGGWLDPAIAESFARHGLDLLREIDGADTLAATLEAEPAPWRVAREPAIERIAAAFADMTDLKSPSTLGHSALVARLAVAAAERLGLDAEECRTLRCAALLHDLGRTGIPAGIWEKGGRLTSGEWERVRLHPYYTERILGRSPALEAAGAIASLHHERLDGSGYHRGARARELPLPARILAAADALAGMVQDRPHRSALSLEAAAEALSTEAREGRLEPEAVTALLEVSGAPAPRLDRVLPAGLSDREVEVLRLLAAGCTNREIADRLVISRRTAEHHVQHIYDKIGLSTRAGAAMFAAEHGLVTPA
jgi:HD-GYP domain-containing protein (c-di-GMP phosphodiesterase class II)